MQGHLIGINTALIGPIGGNVGIGLAIPSSMVKLITDELIKNGKVERGLLGVFVQDLTPELADAMNISGKKGALVTNVMSGSPAQKAGLEVQDVVIDINGTEITGSSQLRNMVGLMPLKSKLAIRVLRKDKVVSLKAVIVSPKEFKKATEPGSSSLFEGVRLTSYDELIPDFGLVKGVVALDVDETSDAWISGLRQGDMIISVNGKETVNLETLLTLVKGSDNHLLLKVGRGAGVIFLVLNKYSS
jgi:S1-C subfamily serine protease